MRSADDNPFSSNTGVEHLNMWLLQLVYLPDVILALRPIWLVELAEEWRPPFALSKRCQFAAEVSAS